MSTDVIRDRSNEYVKGASVKRNAHMNRWRGDDPTPEQSASLVGDLLAEAGEIPTALGVGAFSDHLVAAAGRVLRRESELPRELRVAVLVDFINWAAGRFYGCDLALYISDVGA